jgi:hypothetical protein
VLLLALGVLGLLALSGKSQITVGELLGGEVESGAAGQTHGEEERVNLNGDLDSLLGGLVLGVSKNDKHKLMLVIVPTQTRINKIELAQIPICSIANSDNTHGLLSETDKSGSHCVVVCGVKGLKVERF